MYKYLSCFILLISISTAAIETHQKHLLHLVKSSISTQEALTELKEGNHRFITNKLLHPKDHLTKREKLTTGQHPFAIIFSCSDSRVPPELIFDQGLGDLFIIRVIGHTLDTETTASIEYGISQLGARLIVILGHESCGAISTVLATQSEHRSGSTDLDRVLNLIRPDLKAFEGKPIEDPTLRLPVIAHVNATATQLIKRSQIVRDRMNAGKLEIALSIYHLSSGEVQFWKLNEDPGTKPERSLKKQ